MKTVSHQEFNRHLCRMPGHVHPVVIKNTIEFYYAQQLVGVLVKNGDKPVKRLVPTPDEIR
jgi:hypothetical protein